jgi:Fe-S-cluster containining protein
VFLLSPGIIKKHGQVIVGTELPANPMGRCVFLKDGKCEIHPVKPMECRKYDHTQNHDTSVRTHEEVGALWNNDKSREQIEELLGREPIAEEYSFLDAITWKYS